MTRHHTAFRRFAFSAILLATPFNSAFAQDVTAVAERLRALSAKHGINFDWSSVSGDASNMVIEGVTAKPAGETDALAIGNVTLTDVSGRDGGYVVGTLATSPFSMTEDGVAVDISAFVVNELVIPADGDPMSMIAMYQNASLASLTVKLAGKTAFALENMAFQVTPPDGGRPMEFSGGIEKFSTDLTLIDDPNVQGYVKALGYSQLDGFLKLAGTWQPADGRWAVSQYDIAFNDVGTLGMTADISGFTPAVIQSMNEISARIAEAPEGADTSAEEAQILGALENSTFNGASLRFTDDSITSRAVGLVAAQQGTEPANVVAMAKAMIPFAMAQIQLGELANALSPAINAFLDDPKNIEIVLAPPAPVTFGKIAEVSTVAPDDSAAAANALWELLGITVSANQ